MLSHRVSCGVTFKELRGLKGHEIYCKQNPSRKSTKEHAVFEPTTCDCGATECRAGKLWNNAGAHAKHRTAVEKARARVLVATASEVAAPPPPPPTKLSRKSYQLRFKPRVVKWVQNLIENDATNQSAEAIETRARVATAAHFKIDKRVVLDRWKSELAGHKRADGNQPTTNRNIQMSRRNSAFGFAASAPSSTLCRSARFASDFRCCSLRSTAWRQLTRSSALHFGFGVLVFLGERHAQSERVGSDLHAENDRVCRQHQSTRRARSGESTTCN